MLTLERNSTDVTPDAMTGIEVMQHLKAFEAEISADGGVFNASFMWKTAAELQHTDITGDAYALSLALSSLTRRPGQGCRATHAQIARRMATLKKMFRLAHTVGWQRMFSILGIEENYG